ncbi:hypothetical protein [Domibacillus iocasae]|nr:hypothetical protein [Domibacillus iocasae]
MGEDSEFFTKEAIQTTNDVLDEYVARLEQMGSKPAEEKVMKAVELVVTRLNKMNDTYDYFIETDEREDLCEFIKEKDEEIKEAFEEACEENWTESDKDTCIKQLMKEKHTYENMIEQISAGVIPKMEVEMELTGGCYLFGCKQHDHSEYEG